MDLEHSFLEASDLSDEVVVTTRTPVHKGPYSFVYQGTCRGQAVAIKMLLPLGNGISQHTMRRKVNRERIVWATLRHPNIAPLLGYVDDTDRLPFFSFGALISPWYSFGDATAFLQGEGSRLSLGSKFQLWRQVTSGVAYLHCHNPPIVHGDLKPRNILIDDYGTAKICDFGLVSVITEDRSTGLTTTSPYSGTERYLAPELLADQTTRLKTASDIWALGCIGLEFISGQIPYAHLVNSRTGQLYQEIMASVLPVSRPSELSPEEKTIWMIIESCCLVERDERPGAIDVLDRVADFLEPPPTIEDVGTMDSSSVLKMFSQLSHTIRSLVKVILRRIQSTLEGLTLGDVVLGQFPGFLHSLDRFLLFLKGKDPYLPLIRVVEICLHYILRRRTLADLLRPFVPGVLSEDINIRVEEMISKQKGRVHQERRKLEAMTYLSLRDNISTVRNTVAHGLLQDAEQFLVSLGCPLALNEFLGAREVVDAAITFRDAATMRCTTYSFIPYLNYGKVFDPDKVEAVRGRGDPLWPLLPIGMGLFVVHEVEDQDGSRLLYTTAMVKAKTIFNNWTPSFSRQLGVPRRPPLSLPSTQIQSQKRPLPLPRPSGRARPRPGPPLLHSSQVLVCTYSTLS